MSNAATNLQQEVFDLFKAEPLSHPAQLVSRKTMGYETASGSPSIQTEVIDCRLIFDKAPNSGLLSQRIEIKEGDALCLLATLGANPTKGDQVIFGSRNFEILSATEDSAGTSSLYWVLMR